MVKVIKLYYEDRVIVVDKSKIAKIEAKRRAIMDEDESKENITVEYEYLMNDDYDVYDYIVNSMNWKDLEPFVIDVFKIEPVSNADVFHSYELLEYKDTDESVQFYDYET